MLFLSCPHDMSREIQLQKLDWGWTEEEEKFKQRRGRGSEKSHSFCVHLKFLGQGTGKHLTSTLNFSENN